MEYMVNVSSKDIDKLKDLVKRYNATPESKRPSYWELNQDIEITLLRSSDGDEAQDEYLLQAIPEWADSYDSIEAGDRQGVFDQLSDYYDEIPTDPYRQELRLVVIHHDWTSMTENKMNLDDFKEDLDALLEDIKNELD